MAKSKPRRNAETKHAKNPPMASPIFPFTAPQTAGIAPTITPAIMEPIIGARIVRSIFSPPCFLIPFCNLIIL